MKVDRLVSIIMLLLEKERLSAQELARRFEVSPRTIYRDIETINMAGLPVRGTVGVGGGFEIMKEYKLEKKLLSASDLSTILMGLGSLSTLMRGDEVVNALAKVQSFIPAERTKDIAFRANQISIDPSPWLGNPSIQPKLERIKAAMQGSRLISFAYVNIHGTRTKRSAEPYQLVLKHDHWYLQAYCLLREDYRLFKLARMAELELLPETFVPREFQKPLLDAWPQSEPKQLEIMLRVERDLLERMLDFCAIEDVTPDGDEHYLIRFPFFENDYYYGVLLSFGAQCQCLRPKRVCMELKRRIWAMVTLYET